MQSGYLIWDSEFFNKQVAFIEVTTCDSEDIIPQINNFFKNCADCIYVYSKKLIDFSHYDYVLADKKRTYVLKNPQFNKINNKWMIEKPFYKGEAADLYGLAWQSGEHSRFKVDSHFTEEQFRNLYKKWIDNSLNEGFADYMIVAKDTQPIGFITAKLKDAKIVIGLFATEKNYRGKGIGKCLMQEIINIAAEKELDVEVVTQSDNEVACRFYEKMGFEISDETYVYHIWNKKTNEK